MVIKKEGQIFVEFFAIFVVVMVAFMIFLSAGVNYVDELTQNQELKTINIVLDDFKIKTLTAVDSISDFNATIIVPDNINERNFEIYLENSALIVLMGQGSVDGFTVSASKLLPGVTGNVIQGCNLIVKNDTAIHILGGGC